MFTVIINDNNNKMYKLHQLIEEIYNIATPIKIIL